MVAGEGIEGAQLVPAGAQLDGGVAVEAWMGKNGVKNLKGIKSSQKTLLPQISAPTRGTPKRLKLSIANVG